MINNNKNGQNAIEFKEKHIANLENIVSTETIKSYLMGMRYPTHKLALINKAMENGAPSNVIHIISQFQEKQYNGSIEVKREIERIKEEI